MNGFDGLPGAPGPVGPVGRPGQPGFKGQKGEAGESGVEPVFTTRRPFWPPPVAGALPAVDGKLTSTCQNQEPK